MQSLKQRWLKSTPAQKFFLVYAVLLYALLAVERLLKTSGGLPYDIAGIVTDFAYFVFATVCWIVWIESRSRSVSAIERGAKVSRFTIVMTWFAFIAILATTALSLYTLVV